MRLMEIASIGGTQATHGADSGSASTPFPASLLHPCLQPYILPFPASLLSYLYPASFFLMMLPALDKDEKDNKKLQNNLHVPSHYTYV